MHDATSVTLAQGVFASQPLVFWTSASCHTNNDTQNLLQAA